MNVSVPSLAATAWSVYLPGVRPGAAFAGTTPRLGDWAWREAPAPDRAFEVLGRKGLLGKDAATRLALCAVHRALGLPAGHRPERSVDPQTAVVACSNLGNVGTVASVARTLAAAGGREVSLLDSPNLSANVLASTVGRWFGFGGPNLMVCSGHGAGLDGLRLASLLLRTGRATRVVLVGAEPDDEVAKALYGDGSQLRAAAACVLLRPAFPPVAGQPALAGMELVAGAGRWPRVPRLTIGRSGFDPVAAWGDCYGARDVVALALAAHLAVDEGLGPVAVSDVDGQPAALIEGAR